MIHNHSFDFISSVLFCSEKGSKCLILSEQFFIGPIVILPVVIADILSENSWSAGERLIFFHYVFTNAKTKSKHVFHMLRYASAPIVN